MRHIADVSPFAAFSSGSARERVEAIRKHLGRTGPAEGFGTCVVCGGRGWVGSWTENDWCPECRGSGTDTAKRVHRGDGFAGCQRCRGVGWLRRDVPLGHPEFGKALRCPDCARGEPVGERLRRAGVPESYLAFTLRSYEVGRELSDSQEAALSSAQSFAADPWMFAKTHGKAGLLLYGPAGTMKTGLLIAVLSAVFERYDVRVRFLSWRRLLRDIRASYDADAVVTEAQVLQPALEAEVLLLDDFASTGTASRTNWMPQLAWELWEARYAGALAVPPRLTLATANLSLEEVEREMGDVMGGPILSRIVGTCEVLHVAGLDSRQEERHGSGAGGVPGAGEAEPGSEQVSRDSDGSGRAEL